MLLFHLLEDMERLVGVFCRDTMQTCCSLKFAICLAGVAEQPKFISVAQCLKTPLGFEPEPREQATSMTRPSRGKKCAVKVGMLPILDLAAEFSAAHMARLDNVAMPQMPPSTAIPADDPIRIESQYYSSLVTCAFAGPNEAMQALGTDAKLSFRGPPGQSYRPSTSQHPRLHELCFWYEKLAGRE